jgi:hypothetical protein
MPQIKLPSGQIVDFGNLNREQIQIAVTKLRQKRPEFFQQADPILDPTLIPFQGQPDIGGPATFGESIERGKEGVIGPLGTSLVGFGRIAEEKFGIDAKPLIDYGKKIKEDSDTRLAGIVRDKTTFRDVEETFEEKGFLETLPVFGQYAKEVFGEQLPNLGAFAGSSAVGSLVSRAALGATGPVGAIAGGASFLIPHFFGNNAERKQEVMGEGFELDANDYIGSLKAALAQAPLALFADRILLGLGPTSKLLESGGIFTRVVTNAATGVAAEVPTEIGESIIERYQAGLPIDSEEAIEEYREVGVAAGLFGGTTRATTSVGKSLLGIKDNENRQGNDGNEITSKQIVDDVFNDAAKKDADKSNLERQVGKDAADTIENAKDNALKLTPFIRTATDEATTTPEDDFTLTPFDPTQTVADETQLDLGLAPDVDQRQLDLDFTDADTTPYVVNAFGNNLDQREITSLNDNELESLIAEELYVSELLEGDSSSVNRLRNANANVNAARLERKRRQKKDTTKTDTTKTDDFKLTPFDPTQTVVDEIQPDPIDTPSVDQRQTSLDFKRADLEQQIEDFRTKSRLDIKDVEATDLIDVNEKIIDPRYFEKTDVEKLNIRKQVAELEARKARGDIKEPQFSEELNRIYAKATGLPSPLDGKSNAEIANFIELSTAKNSNSYIGLERIAGREAALKHLAGDIATSKTLRDTRKKSKKVTQLEEELSSRDTTNERRAAIVEEIRELDINERNKRQSFEDEDLALSITKNTQNFGPKPDDDTSKLFFSKTGGKDGLNFYESLNDDEKTFVIESAKRYRNSRLKRDVKGTGDLILRNFNKEINTRQNQIKDSQKSIKEAKGDDTFTDEDKKDVIETQTNIINALQTEIDFLKQTKEEYADNKKTYEKTLSDLETKINEAAKKDNKKLITKFREQRDVLIRDYIEQLDNFSKSKIEEENKFQPLYTEAQEKFIVESVNPFRQQAIKVNGKIAGIFKNKFNNKNRIEAENEAKKEVAKLGGLFKTLLDKREEFNLKEYNKQFLPSEQITETYTPQYISDEFMTNILKQTLPNLFVPNPFGYGEINLVSSFIESFPIDNPREVAASINRQTLTTNESIKDLLKDLQNANAEVIKEQSVTMEDVEREISTFLNVSRKTVRDRVNIFKNPSESEITQNLPPKAKGAVVNGKVFLFSDNITKGSVKAVFLHEMGVHVGMKELLGGNFNNLYNRAKQFEKTKDKGSPEYQIALQTMLKMQGKKFTSEDQKKEEYIAYFIETAVEKSIDPTQPVPTAFVDKFRLKKQPSRLTNWFKQFKATAGRVIEEIFGIDIFKKQSVESMSPQDFVNFAYGAAKLSLVDKTGEFYNKNEGKFQSTSKSNSFDNKINLSLPSGADISADQVLTQGMGKGRVDLLPIGDSNFLTKATDNIAEAPKWSRRAFYSTLSFNQLADTVRRFSPSLANSIQKIERVSAEKRYAIEEYRGLFRDDVIKLKILMKPYQNTDTLKKFNRITTESSLRDENGKRYDLREYFKRNPDPEVANSALYKEFATLPKELQAAYKIIVDRYEEMGNIYQESVLNLITEASVGEGINTRSQLEEQLNNQDISSARRAEIVEKIKVIDAKILSDKQKIANQLFTTGKITPFIPLVRRGRYWIKEAGPKDTSPSYAFETMKEAERARKYLVSKGVELVKDSSGEVIFEKIGNEDLIYGDLKDNGAILEAMKIIRKQLGTDPNDLSNPKVEQILADMQEVYIASQPKESIMQQFKRRREIPGFEDDILQNFAHMGMKYANQIATLQYNAELNRAYDQALTIAAPGGKAGKKFAEVVATLQGRKEFLLDPVPSTWSAIAAYGGYAWFILGNISSAIVNLSQLFLVGLGLMAGEFGFIKSSKAIQEAFSLYASGGRDDNTDLTIGKVSLRDFSLFAKNGKTMNDPKILKKFGVTVEEMEQLYSTALSRSGVRRSSAQELQDIRKGSVDQFTGYYSKAELGLGWFFQNSERMNREVALVAAFKLAKGKYKKANTEQLINRALEIVEDINGPALGEVGPEILQNNLGKAFGVFKRFAFSQIYLQWKLLRDAFGALDTVERNPDLPAEMPSAKQLARRQFFSSFAPAMVFAGLRGAPFFGAIALMHDLVADDDEEDFDMVVRGAVGDIFYRGPLSHFTNLDFASRTGFYQLAFRDDPYRRAQIGNVAFALEQTAGPVYSILRSPDRALDYYNKGETDKAIETMLPSFIRNPLKAFRFGTEGALNSKGYPIVDDVTGYNQALQLLGFSPNDLANQYQKNEFLTRLERGINNKRQRLLTKYYFATQLNDQDELQRIRQEIQEFNAREVVKKGKRTITGDTISKSLQMRDRKAREAVNGIVLPEPTRTAILQELNYQE